MKRVLLDQGCARSTALLLNQEGWDAVHVGDIGMSRATDVDILQRARVERRVCVTLDADFHTELAVSGARDPSAVRIRIEGLDASALAALIRRIWLRLEGHLDRGALVTVDSKSIRIRSLPIARAG